MMRLGSSLVLVLGTVSLNACTLESFEIEPCEQNGTVGFRIAPIDGWFSGYLPRPNDIFVRTSDGRSYEEARVWATRLNYNGPDDKDFESRPAQTMVLYGQKFHGWELEQPPKPMSHGLNYSVHISDGGHNGHAKFRFGEPLPDC
ncbi:hypothetical protein QWY75_05755 [Pontixanthobacter aestiaquae]|uniref:Uncharacterized protein n=1 Tax=Pontixanthobacter aestiaquae TaxID=1509367 RepID=A0A844Z5U7_9SPHN|nr:hypothetical protein [Pontixanthobacter aestiaquae]MDN3645709.1 hypothetical protein [Pontixanthobacter aestiaquae]MXO83295.1 hypothetical protein [Pontixanthobacter aestiaquae]